MVAEGYCNGNRTTALEDAILDLDIFISIWGCAI